MAEQRLASSPAPPRRGPCAGGLEPLQGRLLSPRLRTPPGGLPLVEIRRLPPRGRVGSLRSGGISVFSRPCCREAAASSTSARTTESIPASCSGARKSDGAVFAFEPHPEVFVELQRQFGDLANCRLFRLALSSRRRDGVYLCVPKLRGIVPEPALSYLSTTPEPGAIPVEVRRLDDFAGELAKIDFIKVDIEGGEVDFLEGSSQTIATHRPLILFECMDMDRQYEVVRRFAEPRDYHLCELDAEGRPRRVEPGDAARGDRQLLSDPERARASRRERQDAMRRTALLLAWLAFVSPLRAAEEAEQRPRKRRPRKRRAHFSRCSFFPPISSPESLRRCLPLSPRRVSRIPRRRDKTDQEGPELRSGRGGRGRRR